MLDMLMADERNTTNLSIVITKEQRHALRRAINGDPMRNNLSELVRQWLADYVESRGIEWPENELEWGGKRDKK